ncbi:hypothetical protein V8E55_001298 [Tylopilus felleus]
MSDYYWPLAIPNATHLAYVTQIKYTVHPTTAGYFEVRATNTTLNSTEHRAWLPKYYVDHFMKFLFRFNLCIRLWHKYQGNKRKVIKKRLPRLIRIMCHLDNVGESIIRPSLSISTTDIERWRCTNFDEYLVTEFLLGRHDPTTVQEFRRTTRMNIERIPLQGLNWEEYNSSRINTKLEGRGYRYSIDNVPKTDLDELWKLLEEHYDRPLDSKWVSRWVNSEIDDEGSQQVEGEESEESDKGKGKGSDGSREDEDNKEDEDEDNKEKETDDSNNGNNHNGSSDDDSSSDKQEDDERKDDEVDYSAFMDVSGDDEDMEVDRDKGDEEEQEQETQEAKVEAKAKAAKVQVEMKATDFNPTPLPPNQLMLGEKRSVRDEDDEDEMPRKKRSVTPTPPTPVTETLMRLGFDPTLVSNPAPSEEPLTFPTVSCTDQATMPITNDLPINLLTDDIPDSFDMSPFELDGDVDMLGEHNEPHHSYDEDKESSMNTSGDRSIKRPRGRPKGSTKRGKGKQKETSSPTEFIYTEVIRGQSSVPNQYDMVRVTISPRENPPVLLQQNPEPEISRQHTAGPSMPTQRSLPKVSSIALSETDEKAFSILTGLVDTVHSLAKQCMNDMGDVDAKLIEFLSALKKAGKKDASVSNAISHIKGDKHAFNSFVKDTTRLGLCLQRMEKNGKDVNTDSKKGFLILARECGLTKN